MRFKKNKTDQNFEKRLYSFPIIPIIIHRSTALLDSYNSHTEIENHSFSQKFSINKEIRFSFYKQPGSGFSSESCLYFQGF